MISDFKILLNTKQYDAGAEIKVNSKVRSSCWYKVLMYLTSFVTIMVVCEPLVIIFESSWILGFRGSVCRGDYEPSFELKFFAECASRKDAE